MRTRWQMNGLACFSVSSIIVLQQIVRHIDEEKCAENHAIICVQELLGEGTG